MHRVIAALHALFVGVPMWLAVSLIWLPLFLVGLPLVALLTWRGAWHLEKSKRYPNKHESIGVWNSRWADYLYGNDEDGVTGDMRWWPTYCDGKGWGPLMGVFMWSAIRNPVNNFRFTKLVDYGFNPNRIRYVGNSLDCHQDLVRARAAGREGTFWFYCWHGIYPAFWLIKTRGPTEHLRFRIGWKHTPAFKFGIPINDYRLASESFTPMQLGVRKG